MKTILITIILLIPGVCFAQQEKVDLLVVGGQVFNTNESSFESNSGIAIEGRRIAKTNVDSSEFSADQIIKLNDDEYILPGLIDCHAHYNLRLIKKRREEFSVMPVIYLANGATVTFSCGEFDPHGMLALRKKIESGDQIGPRLINSGPYFGRARPSWSDDITEQEIRDEVDYWAKKGVGGFKAKSIVSGSLQVLIDQAHKHGLTVTGHLGSGFRDGVNPRDAITMGIDRVEHFLGGDAMSDTKPAYASLQSIRSGTPEHDKIVKHFVDNKTAFNPTLTAYGYFGMEPGKREEYGYWIDETEFFTNYFKKTIENRKPMKGMEIYQRVYDAKLSTIAAFHQAGGIITLGTDHVSNGNHLPGFGVHRELDAFVRSGIPAVDAIKIATINGARALKIEKDHGSIEAGKYADLVVISGDPIKNIRNTRNVKKVIRQGAVYDSKTLLNSVRGKLGPAKESELEDW